jgi:hypothetical protein
VLIAVRIENRTKSIATLREHSVRFCDITACVKKHSALLVLQFVAAACALVLTKRGAAVRLRFVLMTPEAEEEEDRSRECGCKTLSVSGYGGTPDVV